MPVKKCRQNTNRIKTLSVEQRIGQMLREIRLQKEMTLEELATAAGTSHQQIYKIERGINRLSLSRFYTLMVYLDIAPEVFLHQVFSQDTALSDGGKTKQQLPDDKQQPQATDKRKP
ncbi:MAG: Putative DNA-binding protein [Candidatus Tokpelaia hoelldobleri]|uniref:DNA-binding protein n=1 Tax=Candidatus Tokpelaia hoelldobleri TaxID=1902579 RepID=A0A1U9JWF2_9HYPH|nr:MAG: Putative DNA-binding protein [Candidatus Tokpelaia hoelldoblerii]